MSELRPALPVAIIIIIIFAADITITKLSLLFLLLLVGLHPFTVTCITQTHISHGRPFPGLLKALYPPFAHPLSPAAPFMLWCPFPGHALGQPPIGSLSLSCARLYPAPGPRPLCLWASCARLTCSTRSAALCLARGVCGGTWWSGMERDRVGRGGAWQTGWGGAGRRSLLLKWRRWKPRHPMLGGTGGGANYRPHLGPPA